MSETRIPLCEPFLGGNEAKYLQECVETNFVSSVGPFVERFEKEFGEFVGSPNAVACSSGTAAIHLALRVAGIEPGDEVFVSDFTFIATVNPIVYLNARPVLIDADQETWNMDPKIVIDELDRRSRAGITMPKAVLVAHILGLPANIEPISEACEKHGVILIEDAAEALGASYREGRFAGKQVGTVGRIGCYSFNGNKIMTTGGGGMIVTTDQGLARRARHLTVQARLPGLEYSHDEVGYNYRLSNVHAAIGMAQLEQLPRFLRRKSEIAIAYEGGLQGLGGVGLPPKLPWALASNWLYSCLFNRDDDGSTEARVLNQKLAELRIDTRPVWMPVHMMEVHSNHALLRGSAGEWIWSKGLSLPSSVSLTANDQHLVIKAIESALA